MPRADQEALKFMHVPFKCFINEDVFLCFLYVDNRSLGFSSRNFYSGDLIKFL